MPFSYRKALSEKEGEAGKFGWKYQEHILLEIQTLYHLLKCQSWNPARTRKGETGQRRALSPQDGS